MSNVNTITTKVAHTSATTEKIVLSYTAASNHAANVFFDCMVRGSAGGTQSEFFVYCCDSFTGGTSSPITQTKVRQTDPETAQGSWLSWDASSQPTPSGSVLVDQITLGTQQAGPTRVRDVRGGKSIYITTKNATVSTPVDITGNCNQ